MRHAPVLLSVSPGDVLTAPQPPQTSAAAPPLLARKIERQQVEMGRIECARVCVQGVEENVSEFKVGSPFIISTTSPDCFLSRLQWALGISFSPEPSGGK